MIARLCVEILFEIPLLSTYQQMTDFPQRSLLQLDGDDDDGALVSERQTETRHRQAAHSASRLSMLSLNVF